MNKETTCLLDAQDQTTPIHGRTTATTTNDGGMTSRDRRRNLLEARRFVSRRRDSAGRGAHSAGNGIMGTGTCAVISAALDRQDIGQIARKARRADLRRRRPSKCDQGRTSHEHHENQGDGGNDPDPGCRATKSVCESQLCQSERATKICLKRDPTAGFGELHRSNGRFDQELGERLSSARTKQYEQQSGMPHDSATA